MPIRAYYNAKAEDFLLQNVTTVLGVLATEHQHELEEQQRSAWIQEITLLQGAIKAPTVSHVLLECYIPRMGKRADAVLVCEALVLIIEFKVGASEHQASALAQVEDYALDLKNFHEGSHDVSIVPILVSTEAKSSAFVGPIFATDGVAAPLRTNAADLGSLLRRLGALREHPKLDVTQWMSKGYRPTPTIIEAAQVLYRTHEVTDISRSDAGAKNLARTSKRVSEITDEARAKRRKAICFVTGVPGSRKTPAGLNIATTRSAKHVDENAVFLAGNGPQVTVLRQALAPRGHSCQSTDRAAELVPQ